MNLFECQELAKTIGYDSTTFDLCFPKGKISCRWLDAYLGLFKKEHSKGFMVANDFKGTIENMWCENIQVKSGSRKGRYTKGRRRAEERGRKPTCLPAAK